jgi:glycosyltransferase involved in cell wall biosynthesis
MPTYFGPTNIPPLEAMELGCPVIVSNKYAMCEQVGDAGLLCDPDSPEDIANCIMQVWGNEEKRKDMIVKGYEQCRKWTRKDFKRLVAKIVVRELME